MVARVSKSESKQRAKLADMRRVTILYTFEHLSRWVRAFEQVIDQTMHTVMVLQRVKHSTKASGYVGNKPWPCATISKSWYLK